MAQFTAGGGRLKPLVTGNGLSVGFGAFHRRCRVKCFGGRGVSVSFRLWGDRKRKLTSTVYASRSLSSPPSSSATSNSGDVFEHVFADDSEFAIDELSGFRGLVLDISYRPVNVVCWKRAICLEFMDKADVLEYYDQTINSPSGSFYIPAVLRVPHLLQVVKRRKVAACSSCNSRKGQKTLEEANMKLLKVPKAPKDYDILAIPLTNHAVRMLKVRKGMPDEWKDYLSKPYAAP